MKVKTLDESILCIDLKVRMETFEKKNPHVKNKKKVFTFGGMYKPRGQKFGLF